MFDVIEAFYESFASNLNGWEVGGVLLLGLLTLLGLRRNRYRWLFYAIFWGLFVVYITTVRRWLGAQGVEQHHGRLAGDILNVLMLIPFGFCCRMLLGSGWIRRLTCIRRPLNTGIQLLFSFLAGLAVSAAVESLQYITGCGTAEITDLVTNSSGALLGALLSLLIGKQIDAWIGTEKKADPDNKTDMKKKADPENKTDPDSKTDPEKKTD